MTVISNYQSYFGTPFLNEYDNLSKMANHYNDLNPEDKREFDQSVIRLMSSAESFYRNMNRVLSEQGGETDELVEKMNSIVLCTDTFNKNVEKIQSLPNSNEAVVQAASEGTLSSNNSEDEEFEKSASLFDKVYQTSKEKILEMGEQAKAKLQEKIKQTIISEMDKAYQGQTTEVRGVANSLIDEFAPTAKEKRVRKFTKFGYETGRKLRLIDKNEELEESFKEQEKREEFIKQAKSWVNNPVKSLAGYLEKLE